MSEGVHPKIVAVPSGQGHTSYGKWQKGIGSNPNEVIGVDFDRLSGQAAFFNTRVKVYKHETGMNQAAALQGFERRLSGEGRGNGRFQL